MSIQSEYLRDIANAIREREGSAGLVQARTFAQRIRDMPNRKLSYPLDPQEVYEATRPADWLPMPEPGDNEMYLLFHIPDGLSSLLAFTVTCTGEYTVALGTVRNGAFLQASSTVLSSGDKYETELFARDWGDLTGNGMKQVMVKVSGPDILTWESSAHSKKTSPKKFGTWNIVEIVCKLPNGLSVKCGNSTPTLALKKLRYFTWLGENHLTTAESAFRYCYSLVSIPELDTRAVTNMVNMFYYCYSLTAIPELATHAVTNMGNMFCGCSSLTAIPELDTHAVTNMIYMFSSCYSLTAVPELDTHAVTNMSGMFNSCYSLVAIPKLDIDTVTDMKGMFQACYSLAAFKFGPSITDWAGYDLSLADCSLSGGALVELFRSMPSVTSSPTLTIYGNPGVSDLTDTDRAIATGKGWLLDEAMPASAAVPEGPEIFDADADEEEPYERG